MSDSGTVPVTDPKDYKGELVALRITVEVHPAVWDAEYGTASREEMREDVEDYIHGLIAGSDAVRSGAIRSVDVRRKIAASFR